MKTGTTKQRQRADFYGNVTVLCATAGVIQILTAASASGNKAYLVVGLTLVGTAFVTGRKARRLRNELK